MNWLDQFRRYWCVRGLEGLEDVVVVWSCLVCFLDRLCCFTVISIIGLLASSVFLLDLPVPLAVICPPVVHIHYRDANPRVLPKHPV